MLSVDAFYDPWSGHNVDDLRIVLHHLRSRNPDASIVFLAGDSSADNKYWVRRGTDPCNGYETIFDLPDDLELSPTAERQRRAVQGNEIIVEEGLRAALDRLEAPIAHLDFETISPAIPAWEGCRPYDPVPVQFRCKR